jgi:C-terminal peptidase prc
MKRTATFIALLVVPLLTFAPAGLARAQDEKPGQPYIVLVGIDHYKDKQILPRKHAEADAAALYDLFRDKGHLHVEPSHIKLILGSEDKARQSEPATRASILGALKWVADNAKAKDLVIVGYFGQGAPLGQRTCYFVPDSTFQDRDKNAIAAVDIEQALSKLKSQRFVVFLDVNFNGFDLGKKKRPEPNLEGGFYKEFLGGDDAGDNFSRVVFVANSGLKPSLNEGKHGLFTQVLLDGLNGKADKAGYEADGLVTIEELAEYVRSEMPALVRKVGKTEEEKAQMPIVLEGESSNFVVDLNPAITAKVEQRLKNIKKLVIDNNITKIIAEEGEHLLQRMPKLEARQSLRKEYQKFADGDATFAQFKAARDTILASMRLPEPDVNRYAQLVIRGTHKVLEDFFKESNEGEMVASAIDGLYKSVSEKVPSDIAAKLKNPKKLSEVALVKLLQEARRHLGKREDLDDSKDITYSLHTMLNKLDRHTDYYDPDTVRRLTIDTQGKFSGIGVQIRKSDAKGALEVVTPIKGSPAYKAGIYTGDYITKIIREVDGKGKPLPKPEVISTKGMTTEEAVKKILGKTGTKVKLVVEREGSEKPLEFELVRGQVEVETVVGFKRKKNDSWDYVIDPENKICYIRLTQFSANTHRDLARAMKQLSKAGIKGFILDLRFNPGGLLDSAVKISDLFIDDGMIVSIRPRNGPETSYVGKSDGSYLSFPMVCLVNGYSASGSEIVAACLQDHGRAVIIGTRSYGKGSVQTIHPFSDTGGMLKLTTATFWRPSGQNLNKTSTKGRPEDIWGVKPNPGFEVSISRKELNDLQEFYRWHEIIHRHDRPTKNADITKFQDRQLESALTYLRGQIRIAAHADEKKGVAANAGAGGPATP